ANMVPQNAEASVEVNNPEELTKQFNEFLKDAPVSGEAKTEGNQVTLTFVGKAAHGSTPEHGVNAATYLATFLNDYPFEKDAKAFLNITTEYLHENYDGKKLGINYDDELMGHLSSNFGIFEFKADEGGEILANMRYPQGTNE